MISKWPEMLAFIIKWERISVTNDPRDPGGMTAGGISRRYNPSARVWTLVDRGIVRGQEYEAAVYEFYEAKYRELFEAMPRRVGAAYIDALVNMGDGKVGDDALGAAELLQKALNRVSGSDYVTVDGVIGPKTMDALKHCDADAVAWCMCALRLAEYGRRGRKGDPRRDFLDGWINRVRDLMAVL